MTNTKERIYLLLILFLTIVAIDFQTIEYSDYTHVSGVLNVSLYDVLMTAAIAVPSYFTYRLFKDLT